MIARIWHGWTSDADADAYEALLRTEILPGIAARGIVGYQGAHLLRRGERDGEVEFVTVCWFADRAAVRAFAGDDDAVAVVPAAAQALLRRYDERSQHYTTIVAPAPDPAAAISG